jgi:dGTPase
MDWETLLNERRFGDERPAWREASRSPFEQDQDRIIYSTAFRRLAGKTQVFPLPESDVTHHRMTHTLEVASVGRSLGRSVAADAVTED